jgi:hypothetical protein
LCAALFKAAIFHDSSLGWRFGLHAVSGALTGLFFVGLFYRSASLYHPQRRAILHLVEISRNSYSLIF